jgi:hypothetical protein
VGYQVRVEVTQGSRSQAPRVVVDGISPGGMDPARWVGADGGISLSIVMENQRPIFEKSTE